jgi:hypothetical protein
MTRVPVGAVGRRSSTILAPLVAVLLLLPTASIAAARDTATADPGAGQWFPVGYDISYPQCGDPLPSYVAFGIVGVNGGRVYAPNPCLAPEEVEQSQLAWAGPDADLYANTANPGPELSDFWPVGQTTPRACSPDDRDSLDCAYDYGWNAAADSYASALAAYVALGWAEADATQIPAENRWWLDVEVANSWRSDQDRNVAALQGAADYLESMGVGTVGFYSAPRMWQAITGGTDAFADHPSWTAGASTLEEAEQVCEGPGFTGGPVDMAQYFADGFDANHRC